MDEENDREKVEEKLSKLRAALIEGEKSGVSQPFDFDVFIAIKRRELQQGSGALFLPPQ
jgi:Arc/MetJ-type ribon-helix-helix transcriptional regulator